jgi:hypothetical protein
MPRRKPVFVLASVPTTRQTLWFSTAVRQAVVKAVEQQVGVALAAIQAQQKQRASQESSGTAIYGNNVVNVFQIERMDSSTLEMLLRSSGADTH